MTKRDPYGYHVFTFDDYDIMDRSVDGIKYCELFKIAKSEYLALNVDLLSDGQYLKLSNHIRDICNSRRQMIELSMLPLLNRAMYIRSKSFESQINIHLHTLLHFTNRLLYLNDKPPMLISLEIADRLDKLTKGSEYVHEYSCPNC